MNFKKFESTYGKWSPSLLSTIVEVELTSDLEECFCVKIKASYEINKQKTFISLVFSAVNSFTITEVSSIPFQVLGFDIIDVSNSGLENIRYEIEDYESGKISFKCKNIDIFLL